MKRRIAIHLTMAWAAFCVPVFADEATEQFKALMKPAAAANGALQKTLQADLSAAAASAAEVKSKFHAIEQFWAKRGAPDAQTFAKNIQDAADQIAAAASAGRKEEALAAAKQVGSNCQGCHQAHREKAADGSWMIK
jgi:cytochrome c556